MRKIEERYYFAYGSNMNLGQMRFRCPDAEVVGNVRLEDYRLAFRGRAPGNGVATVLPEKGSYVDGVLWKITEACEKNLDFYEGFPNFYITDNADLVIVYPPYAVAPYAAGTIEFIIPVSQVADIFNFKLE